MTSGRLGALLGALLAFLSGCGSDGDDARTAAGDAAPAVRPVKTFVVDTDASAAVRNFPARIEASRHAELSFRVPGTVKDILVKEGDNVSEGAVLARLDPTDYAIVLKDRQASYDNARRNYERARDLLPSGNISRLDFERTEASYKSAEAALSQARQDMRYTELAAPFAGSVARRLVQRFEEVSAKQPVISLQTLNRLDVKIDLPERIVRSLSLDSAASGPDPESAAAAAAAWVSFEGMPGRRFPLALKEVATKADSATQTFEVTFTMENPPDVVLLPGMTATVSGDMAQLQARPSGVRVPARAVLADAQMNPYVWVLDPATLTVARRSVRVGTMAGNRIEVLEGLAGGEEIVAAGASFMAEGMKVSRMPRTEQAVPRADDPL